MKRFKYPFRALEAIYSAARTNIQLATAHAGQVLPPAGRSASSTSKLVPPLGSRVLFHFEKLRFKVSSVRAATVRRRNGTFSSNCISSRWNKSGTRSSATICYTSSRLLFTINLKCLKKTIEHVSSFSDHDLPPGLKRFSQKSFEFRIILIDFSVCATAADFSSSSRGSWLVLWINICSNCPHRVAGTLLLTFRRYFSCVVERHIASRYWSIREIRILNWDALSLLTLKIYLF